MMFSDGFDFNNLVPCSISMTIKATFDLFITHNFIVKPNTSMFKITLFVIVKLDKQSIVFTITFVNKL